jgi:hypothetical protein
MRIGQERFIPYSNILLIALMIVYLLLPFTSFGKAGADESVAEKIELGKWTEGSLTLIMTEASNLGGPGERIDFISEKFLGTPYAGSTLTGSIDTPEVFTIDLEGMDCFTFIDYVEAMSLSDSFPEFKDSLRKIRYSGGVVAFTKRNHFFSDWPINNSQYVKDVTSEVGGKNTVAVSKKLNLKSDGTYYLPGIPVKERIIYYIPSASLDVSVLNNLMTGDFVGIYTDKDGLDASHTGLIIKKGGKVFLRDASSREKNKKVVDEDLSEYMKNRPGLIVYRPIN